MTAASIFSIGAGVKTLIGLLGLVVACGTYLWSRSIGRERKDMQDLPEADRIKKVDQLASLYGLSLANSKYDAEKYKLVKDRMRSRENSIRLFALLGVGGFLASLGMLVHNPRKAEPTSPSSQSAPSAPAKSESGSGTTQGSTAMNATDSVVYYKKQILDLRSKVETRDPGWELDVRPAGVQWADLMGRIDDRQLHSAKIILKHEYRGWALLMVADTFGARHQSDDTQAGYAEQAIQEFELALRKMAQVSQDASVGNSEANDVYKWMTGASADLNRTHYLKAAALAVVVCSGGHRTKAEVESELGKVEPEYRSSYSPRHHPALACVLAAKP